MMSVFDAGPRPSGNQIVIDMCCAHGTLRWIPNNHLRYKKETLEKMGFQLLFPQLVSVYRISAINSTSILIHFLGLFGWHCGGTLWFPWCVCVKLGANFCCVCYPPYSEIYIVCWIKMGNISLLWWPQNNKHHKDFTVHPSSWTSQSHKKSQERQLKCAESIAFR